VIHATVSFVHDSYAFFHKSRTARPAGLPPVWSQPDYELNRYSCDRFVYLFRLCIRGCTPLTVGAVDSAVVTNVSNINWNEVVSFPPFGSERNASSYLQWAIPFSTLWVSMLTNGVRENNPMEARSTTLRSHRYLPIQMPREIHPLPCWTCAYLTGRKYLDLIFLRGTAGLYGPYQDVGFLVQIH